MSATSCLRCISRPVSARPLAYLNDNAKPDDLVLANPRLANYLPSLSGARVYLGHWSETKDFRHKLGHFSCFLRGTTSEDARERFVRAKVLPIWYSMTRRSTVSSRATSPPSIPSSCRRGNCVRSETLPLAAAGILAGRWSPSTA